MELLTPVRLGEVTIKNRVCFAPCTRIRADEKHVATELIAEHYAMRSSGGLLIAEATMVDPDARAFGLEPGLTNFDQTAGYKRVVDAVHARGGHIAVQLWHPGRATHPDLNNGVQPVCSSAKKLMGDTIHTPKGKQEYVVPRALRTEEIAHYVELFRQAAVRAKDAGFDMVEVHGAHGYLIDTFLRDGVNDRTDQYGGSVENRCRLLFEVYDAVATVFGAQRVGVRISPLVPFNDMSDSNPAALVECVARGLQERNAAFLELRAAQHSNPAEIELVHVARRHFRGPIMRNGGYTGEAAEADIKAGLADAVSFGMSYIGNPDLPERIAAKAPLNQVDFTKLYGVGPVGYNDYPLMSAQKN